MHDAKYIGLDVQQATISVAILDCAGKLAMEAILETKSATILQFLQGLRGSLHVTFEEGTGRPGCTICLSRMSERWYRLSEFRRLTDVTEHDSLRDGNAGYARSGPLVAAGR
jgi:hypothetical protein